MSVVPNQCCFSHSLHIIFLNIIIVHTDIAAVSAASNVVIEAELLSAVCEGEKRRRITSDATQNVPPREARSIEMPIIVGPLRECSGGFLKDTGYNNVPSPGEIVLFQCCKTFLRG
ncbi:hypothetical protein BGAL_0063g00120 [Botrytis galanthina]|uniref:Alcohol dehydrogenase N-terminal domain-containing protein n=1 Tax=Botrytis galanthina TaxID=278940 RepID=A0A4S8R9B6_9HELO|nr:hypothetical protein BGAL_0063g00120 [Botrytis galanthina]